MRILAESARHGLLDSPVDDFNPYASSAASNLETYSDSGPVGEDVVSALQKTSPWTRLSGWLIWLCIVLTTVAGALRGWFQYQLVPGLETDASALGSPTAYKWGFIVGAAGIYSIFALVFVYPAMKLLSFSKASRQLQATPTQNSLENVLRQHRGLWTYIGVCGLIILIVIALFIILAIAAGFFVAFG